MNQITASDKECVINLQIVVAVLLCLVAGVIYGVGRLIR